MWLELEVECHYCNKVSKADEWNQASIEDFNVTTLGQTIQDLHAISRGGNSFSCPKCHTKNRIESDEIRRNTHKYFLKKYWKISLTNVENYDIINIESEKRGEVI